MRKKIKILTCIFAIGFGIILPKYCLLHQQFDDCWTKEVETNGTNSGKE
jgi:hypothetical protein